MVLNMKYEYKQKLDDVLSELEIIREWINKDRNKFDVKTKYLISYAVVKASGTIETVFKQIIFDFLLYRKVRLWLLSKRKIAHIKVGRANR